MLFIDVDVRPEFSLQFRHKIPKDDRLWDNGCWPRSAAKDDPGFGLLRIDEWYNKHKSLPKWDYTNEYKKGTNGD
ncbi:glycoside hydrolase family 18 protein [Fusarium flagelliforme]|uniref:Glycoside hydrolase family 18 protein n=1 Tax=Fusarium flagelliforme TaxID=2675880 RepID=A0A395MYJ6_9HYPO|nr:glycoside hydrolase family 18 protein [Fusarium flagelliforme]